HAQLLDRLAVAGLGLSWVPVTRAHPLPQPIHGDVDHPVEALADRMRDAGFSRARRSRDDDQLVHGLPPPVIVGGNASPGKCDAGRAPNHDLVNPWSGTARRRREPLVEARYQALGVEVPLEAP